MGFLASTILGNAMPAFDPNFIYEVHWMFEDDNTPAPHKFVHADPKEAANHLISLWNSGRTLTYICMTRLNA